MTSGDRIFNLERLNPRVGGKKFGVLDSVVYYRAPVPGGWLVSLMTSTGAGVTFYPDPDHTWDGGTLDSGGAGALPLPAGQPFETPQSDGG